MELNITINHFKELKKELKDIDGMEDCFFILQSKAKKSDIGKFEEFIKRSIPASMREIYQIADGFTIKWMFQPHMHSQYILSCSFIRTLSSYFAGQRLRSNKAVKKGERHKDYLWSDGDDPSLIKDLEDNYFILDLIDEIANVSVIFKFEEGKEEPLLYLYTFPHYTYPLKLTFTEYIEKSIEVRGMHCWQEHFIDKEKTDPEALKHLEQQRSYDFYGSMKIVFPDFDFSKLPEIQEQKPQSYNSIAKTKDFQRRFRERISEIENMVKSTRGDFECDYDYYYPLSVLTIRKVETLLGRRLPDSMLAFYSQMNGFNLRWSHKDPSKYKKDSHSFPGGSFKLLGLEHVFGGFDPFQRNWHNRMFEGIVTMEDIMDDNELEFAGQCRLIYSCEKNDTVIRFVDGKEEPELYIIDQGKFIPLQLSFEDFIERLIENLGMEYWQRFFTKPEDYSDIDLSTCPPVPQFIKDVFPDVDISGYRRVKSNIEIE